MFRKQAAARSQMVSRPPSSRSLSLKKPPIFRVAPELSAKIEIKHTHLTSNIEQERDESLCPAKTKCTDKVATRPDRQNQDEPIAYQTLKKIGIHIVSCYRENTKKQH